MKLLCILAFCLVVIESIPNNGDENNLSKCIVDNFGEGAYLYQNLCFNESHIIFPASSLGLEDKSSEDISKINHCLQRFPEHQCQVLVPIVRTIHDRTTRVIVNDEELFAEKHVWKSGPWFYADTTFFSIQFGHVTSKLLQYFSLQVLAQVCSSFGYSSNSTVKYLSVYQSIDELKSMTANLNWIAEESFGSNVDEMVAEGRLDGSQCHNKTCPDKVLWPQLTCFANTIHKKSNEMMFVSPVVGESWSKKLTEKLNPSLNDLCNSPRVLVMQRNEGKGAPLTFAYLKLTNHIFFAMLNFRSS